jgi:hypothetical protein
VGVLVGFALLTALARPAAAASLPTDVIPPPAASALASPDSPLSSNPVAVPVVSGAVSAATDTVAPVAAEAVSPTADPAPLASIPTVVPVLSGAVQTLPGTVSATASGLVSRVSAAVPSTGSLPTPAVNIPTATGTARPTAHSTANHAPSTTAAGSASTDQGAAHSPSAPAVPPTSPTPLPAPSVPLQNTPLTANDATGSLVGQGGALFGSPPPASLLPPVPSIGGVRPAREKVPQLLLASRCTPPG